jgi:hypothetical protein
VKKFGAEDLDMRALWLYDSYDYDGETLMTGCDCSM